MDLSRRKFLRNAAGLMVPAMGLALPPLSLARPRRVPILAGGGGSAPTFFDVSTASSAGGTAWSTESFAEPASCATDDILIVYFLSDTSLGTVTPPTGWTELGSNTGNPSGTGWYVYWIRRGGSSPSFDMSWTTSRAWIAHCSVYRGCIDSGDPYDEFASTTGTTDPADPDPPSVTLAGSNRRVVIGGHTGDTFETLNAPASGGYTKRAGGDLNGFYALALCDAEIASSGSHDPGVMPIASTPSGSFSWTAWTLALKS